MKADVRSSAEKEALKWAIDALRQMQSAMVWNATAVGAMHFMYTYEELGRKHPEQAEAYLHEMLDSIFNGESGELTDQFIEAARLIVANTLERREQLSDDLRFFTIDFMRSKVQHALNPKGPVAFFEKRAGSPGRKHTNQYYRDGAIATAINHVAKIWGFRPTRNAAKKHLDRGESAASIVVKALAAIGVHMTERSVNRIWDERGKDDLPLDIPAGSPRLRDSPNN